MRYKHRKIYKQSFDVVAARELLGSMSFLYKEDHKDLVKTLEQNIEQERINKKDSWRGLVEFLKPYYGSYVRLRLLQYDSKNIISEYVGLPYELNSGLLYGAWCHTTVDHEGGIRDTCINLYAPLFKGHCLDIENITEEEFKNTVNSMVDKCLNKLLTKIKSKDYIFTDTGYIPKNRAKNATRTDC